MEPKKYVASTKEDEDIHKRATIALEHYFKHRDYTGLNKIVLQMPNSNRRIALLKWVHQFSTLRWDNNKNSFTHQKSFETQDIVAANSTPFWEFKIKQEQHRHTSGNLFDSNSFFQSVISDINKNIDSISIEKLETTIRSLQILLEIKQRRLSRVVPQSSPSSG